MRGGRHRERRHERERAEKAEGGVRHQESVGRCGHRRWEGVHGEVGGEWARREKRAKKRAEKRAEENGRSFVPRFMSQ